MEEETIMMTKTTVSNFLKVICIGALVLFSSGALFEVDKYEEVNTIYSKEYKDLKTTYSPINKTRRKDQKENRAKFQALITTGNYTTTQRIELQKIFDNSIAIQETSNIALKTYTKKKKALQESYKYKGWNGYYYFRLAIDSHIMSLVIGLLLLYIIFNPTIDKWKRIVFSIFAGVFIFTSTFFIIKAIFSQQVFQGDFPENWYTNILRFIPIIVAIALPLLFYHYQTIETKLKGYIQSIFTYIYDTTDDIKPELQDKHQLERGKLISKGLDIHG